MRCSWTTVDGATCSAEALVGDPAGRCWFHSDTNAGSRQEARSRGGRASRAPQKPAGVDFDVSTPEAVLATIQATGRALSAGTCDRGTANALGILAKNATDVHRVLGYERRLSAVERRLGLREATVAEEDAEEDHGTA